MVIQELLGASILVVDDEEANVDLLAQLLEREGYSNVRTTTDPRTALVMFDESPPDVILLDLLMPYLDGFAVMEAIRPRIPEDAYLPVLVLTADVSSATRQRALAAGANDFLTKPFDRVELLLRLRNLLQTRALHLRVQAQLAGLERLYRETAETLRVRDESLSAITHDLGQPLTSIKMAALAMRSRTSAGDASPIGEELAHIDLASRRMFGMLGELLDVSRLQAGRALDLAWDEVDLVALARDEIAIARAASAGHTFTLVAEQPELVADADAARISRALSNLLSNAAKFSPGGGQITVRVRRHDGGRAAIEVSDEGVGIPAADLPFVFERFSRGGNVQGRFTGTGLGLSGVRQVMEQHGGAVEIGSVEGAGTTVRLLLPLPEEI